MDGETIDRLILLVCEHEELYDMANRNYSNQNRRENIWSEIGKKINESGQTCKKKWKSLRDAFQKAAKNSETKSGQAATSNKKWKYWEAMSFLVPHIKGRETQTNVCDNETDENFEDEGEAEEINTPSQLEEADQQTGEDESYEIPTSLSLSLPNTPQSRSSSGTNISRPVSRTASTKSDTLTKKKMTAANKTEAKKIESLPDILKEYVQDKKRSRLERQALSGAIQSTDGKNSAVWEFFTSMAKTTATFPPLWQAKVKSKVFQLVNSYELALLETSSASPTPPLHTESHAHTQQQSHIQHMHNVPIHNQLPLLYQSQVSPPQIPPSMQIRSSVHDQPSSSSFHHNEHLQGPLPDCYSRFPNAVFGTETCD